MEKNRICHQASIEARGGILGMYKPSDIGREVKIKNLAGSIDVVGNLGSMRI